MAGNTTNLDLYLPGGGSSGLWVPDETADIDKINQNMLKIDAAVGADRSRLTALEADTGWSRTPFTAMTGWGSIARLGIRKIGKLVVCSVEVTRTGASISADASGNIADTAVATVTAPYRIGVGSELIHSMSYTKAGVAMGAWRLDGGGELQIETLHTGNSINTNDAIRLYGVWFTP